MGLRRRVYESPVDRFRTPNIPAGVNNGSLNAPNADGRVNFIEGCERGNDKV
jgi:hypothetical protein